MHTPPRSTSPSLTQQHHSHISTTPIQTLSSKRSMTNTTSQKKPSNYNSSTTLSQKHQHRKHSPSMNASFSISDTHSKKTNCSDTSTKQTHSPHYAHQHHHHQKKQTTNLILLLKMNRARSIQHTNTTPSQGKTYATSQSIHSTQSPPSHKQSNQSTFITNADPFVDDEPRQINPAHEYYTISRQDLS